MISLILQQMAGLIIQVLPCCGICYYLTGNHYKLEKRKLIIHLSLLVFLTLGGFVCVSMYFHTKDYEQTYLWLNLLFLICVFIFGVYFLSVSTLSHWKKAFIFIFAFNYGLFVGLIKNSMCSMYNLYNFSENKLLYNPQILITVTITELVTVPILFHVLLKIRWIVDELTDINIWKRLTYIDLAFCFFYYIYSVHLSMITTADLIQLLATIAIFLAQMLLLYLSCQIMAQMIRSQEAHTFATNMKNQLQIQKMHYGILAESIDLTRRVNHDMRHHLRTLQNFLDEGEYKKAREYLSIVAENTYHTTPIRYCANNFINATLSYYLSQAIQSGIHVEHHIEIDEDVPIDNTDLCVIIGNCLENALDAAKLVPASLSPVIKVKGQPLQNQYIFSVQNPYINELMKEGNKYYSTKHEGLGIGIRSIQKIAEKYQGNANIKVTDSLFRITVILHNES